MDTKTTVDRSRDLPSPVWNDGTATAADMQAAQDCLQGRRSKLTPADAATSDRVGSPDPLRHTDLYRLVMPYQQHL